MTTPNICKEQSCNEKVLEGHYLCRGHSGKEQTGVINECPQCGVYKDAKHSYCRECTVRLPNVLQQAQQAGASSRPKIRPDNADLPDRFIAALGELIRQMKISRVGQKRYELEKGHRIETAGDDISYRFLFADKVDREAQVEIEREDQVEIQVDQRRVEGTIVSIGTGHLVLALKEDIGDEVRSAMLIIYKTVLLEALKEKIEAVNQGEITLNRTLADAVVQPGVLPNRPVHPIQADGGSQLDDSQRAAYYTALREAVTFIWGPPGCGKTMTLSAIVHSAFDGGKRTLICSNTNKAVDQVLYKICEALTHEHPAMEGGKVVRLGRIADDKLASKYGKYVAIDEVAEQRSAWLEKKRVNLKKKSHRSMPIFRSCKSNMRRLASASNWRGKRAMIADPLRPLKMGGSHKLVSTKPNSNAMSWLPKYAKQRRRA